MITNLSLRALTVAEVSRHADIPLEALRSTIRRGNFPAPDLIIGGTNSREIRGWTTETVDEWLATRSRR